MSEQINELAKALSVVQKTMKAAKKDSTNPFFKSKYADLASVWDACRDELTNNGFSVCQTMEHTEQGAGLRTTLLHSSGQYMSGVLVLNPSKNDPQGIGSALTYARRYALAAIAGVVTEDDDGNAASRPVEAQAKQEATKQDPKKLKIKKLIDQIDKPKTADGYADNIVKLTQLEPDDKNFDEIINRLSVIIEEHETSERMLSEAIKDDLAD